jgi:hypothetical protein
MRHFAVPGEPDAVITADLAEARECIKKADFFETAFGLERGAGSLHREAIRRLLAEVRGWSDEVDRGD